MESSICRAVWVLDSPYLLGRLTGLLMFHTVTDNTKCYSLFQFSRILISFEARGKLARMTLLWACHEPTQAPGKLYNKNPNFRDIISEYEVNFHKIRCNKLCCILLDYVSPMMVGGNIHIMIENTFKIIVLLISSVKNVTR